MTNRLCMEWFWSWETKFYLLIWKRGRNAGEEISFLLIDLTFSKSICKIWSLLRSLKRTSVVFQTSAMFFFFVDSKNNIILPCLNPCRPLPHIASVSVSKKYYFADICFYFLSGRFFMSISSARQQNSPSSVLVFLQSHRSLLFLFFF